MNFAPEMIEAIRRGDKTETRRLASENPGSPWYRHGCSCIKGRTYAICPGRAKRGIGRLEVTGEPRLEKLGDADDPAARREGFAVFSDFRAYWERLHGSFDEKANVWVVQFVPISWEDA